MVASGIERVFKVLRSHWRLPALAGVLLLAWALAGFFWVPQLVRDAVTHFVEQDLGRRVAIGDIAFNPFTLTLDVRDWRLTESDDAPIAAFSGLHVNAELVGSLVHRAWTLKELHLEQPWIDARRDASGDLNLARLMPPAEPEVPDAAPDKPPAIRIGRFSVTGGSVDYTDLTRAAPFHAALTAVEFSLGDFRTTPSHENAYRFEAVTRAGERLTWSGVFTLEPLGSTGSFSIGGLRVPTAAAYLQDGLPFALPSGELDLAGSYRLGAGDTPDLDIDVPHVAVRTLAIAPREAADAAPWILVPSLDIEGTTFSLATRRLRIGRIGVTGAKITAWREPDGSLNLSQLAPVDEPVNGPVDVDTPTGPAWDVGIERIEIGGGTMELEDRSIQPAGRMTLSPVRIRAAGYTLAGDTPLELDANIGFDGNGSLTATGRLTPTPLAADLQLELSDFALPPLQSWVARVAAIGIERGKVGATAQVRLDPEPSRGGSKLEVRGDVVVSDLLTRDADLKQELVRWKRLDVGGIHFRYAPDRLDIDTIRAREPYGRLIIASDQTFNVTGVLAGPDGTVPRSPPDGTAVGGPAGREADSPAPPMPIRIRRVLIEGGTMDFADYSVQPNFTAAIFGLEGSVTGLSSAPESRAEIALKGNVDRYAPVDIHGQINLLSADVYSDVGLDFRNMELTTFNPYSGKFAGYNIAKGKLTTELRYHVEDRRLDAQHHIVVDQLEFGAATDSKDAVPLPVKLAVALLKDRDGVIDIDLPVSGSLDDPAFRVGPIVWKALLGLVREIVTAPFALLGALAGGGADLQFVHFAAGTADLAAAEQDKLARLATALHERPQLTLDVPLNTLSAVDDAALTTAALEAAVAATAPTGDATPAARLRALEALYVQAFGEKPDYPTPPAEDVSAGDPESDETDPDAGRIAWLEAQLKPGYTATPDQRAALARARAEAVRTAILSGGQVTPERVFLTERKSGEGDPADGVRMALKLE